MERAACPRDDENDAVACTNRPKATTAITGTIFPPVLQSQPTSPESEGFEGPPPLYKSIVHIHQKASEKQQKLDAAWIDRDKDEASINVMNRPHTERWNSRNLSSVWERESQEEEEEGAETEAGGKQRTLWCLPDRVSLRASSKQKLEEYTRQWKDGIRLETKWLVTEACVRMICSSLLWCLIMGTWLEQKTTGKWGIAEMVISTVVSGGVFQLFGGQALMIVGPDAPSIIFIVSVSVSAHYLGINAVSWMAWIGVWTSLFLFILAISNASAKLTRHVTLFSWDVVCVFIKLTFLSGAVEQLLRLFAGHGGVVELDSGLLSLWLATLAFFVAASLCNAKRWVRHAATDYAMLIVLSFTTAISHMPKLSQLPTSRVSLPEYMYHSDHATRIERITLRLLPGWAILLAVVPGMMLAGLILVYQNAVTALLQDEAGSDLLYKTSHKWDLCILAVLALFCSLFGLPIPCGMLHQTHCHVRALTVKLQQEYSDMEEQRGLVTKVTVQRVSSIGAALLSATFLSHPMKWIIRKIPSAVLIGLLLQLAFHGWRSWNLLNFITALLMKHRLKLQERIPASSICVYSLVQISCIFVVLAVSKSPAAVLFPLIIFVTLWIRHYALRGLFGRRDYARLDARLYNSYAEVSSSDRSSTVFSPHERNVAQQAWPRFSMTETLKTGNVAAAAPAVGEVQINHSPNVQTNRPYMGGAAAGAESSESPMMPRVMSPSLLFVSNRRLKERSRRRHKRKQMTFWEDPQTQTDEQSSEFKDHESEQDVERVPPLIRALIDEQQNGYEPQDEGINLSRRVSPRLSPQFFKKSKQKSETDSPLEVHSNLLYEPPGNRAARKATGEGKESSAKMKKKQRSEEPASSSTANEPHLYDIRSFGNNRKSEIMVASEESAGTGGGIGRCIRSPPTFVKSQSLKRKKVHLLFSSQRSRSLLQEMYPAPTTGREQLPSFTGQRVKFGGQRSKSLLRQDMQPGASNNNSSSREQLVSTARRQQQPKPLLIYPSLLRRSSTGANWPAASFHKDFLEQQQQRNRGQLHRNTIPAISML